MPFRFLVIYVATKENNFLCISHTKERFLLSFLVAFVVFHKWHSIMILKDVSGHEISEVLVSSECAADVPGDLSLHAGH